MSTSKENIENQSFFQKNAWIKWAVLILAGGAILYFLVNLLPENFEKSSVFTQYGKLQDTMLITSPGIPTEVIDTMALSKTDTMLITSDTLVIEDTITLKSDSILAVETKINKVENDSFKIDESYKFGNGEVITAQQFGEKNFTSSPNATPLVSQKKDLFDELFLSFNPIDTSQIKYQQFFTKKVVSSKTVLKILANVGKMVLLNENSENATTVFESIVEEDNMVGILLVDRKGEIIYSTNRQFLNENIQTIFPALDVKNHMIEWGIGGKQFVTSIAIYHTYGQIGNVILITK